MEKRDGGFQQIIDFPRHFHLVTSDYLYYEYRSGNSTVCELFSLQNYSVTGDITLLTISEYINNRVFSVNDNGICDDTGTIPWNTIYSQSLYYR